MSQIERFLGKLRRTREVMGQRLSAKKGQEEIGEALEEIEEVERRLGWTPKPEIPGIGTTGKGTKRMSRGGPP